MCPIGLGCLTHEPIKWSSTDNLPAITPSRSQIRIVGKGNLFDFATIFTWQTLCSCTGKKGHTGSTPFIGFEVIWDLGSSRSVRSEKRSWDPRSNIWDGPDARWSGRLSLEVPLTGMEEFSSATIRYKGYLHDTYSWFWDKPEEDCEMNWNCPLLDSKRCNHGHFD